MEPSTYVAELGDLTGKLHALLARTEKALTSAQRALIRLDERQVPSRRRS